jgi:hypothetical protein
MSKKMKQKQRILIEIDFDIYMEIKRKEINMTELINSMLKTYLSIKETNMNILLKKKEDTENLIKQHNTELQTIKSKIEHLKKIQQDARINSRLASGDLVDLI